MEYCPRCMRPSSGPRCTHCGRSMEWKASSSQLPAGTILNSPTGRSAYLLGAVLGQGGFGITYIALEINTQTRVAVKEYFPNQLASRNGQQCTVVARPGREEAFGRQRKRFLEEAQMLAGQSSLRCVVSVKECFEANRTAYIVMEYLDGMTLQQQKQAQGRIPAQELLQRMKPLMADLARIHASNVIHRDITPDNLMWMPDGRLVLMDFGSARSMDNPEMSVLLKHEFAPVEQYETKRQGPWTDIYGLSATIYYCITGVMAPKAVDRLERDTLEPPRTFCPDLTPAQESALLLGLAVQPQDRPRSMEDFMEVLYPKSRPPKKPSSAAGTTTTGSGDHGGGQAGAGGAGGGTFAQTGTSAGFGSGTGDSPWTGAAAGSGGFGMGAGDNRQGTQDAGNASGRSPEEAKRAVIAAVALGLAALLLSLVLWI